MTRSGDMAHEPEAAIALTDLAKSFGSHWALNGVDLRVPQGSVFGFLGPNGAGKTTTLRILAGLARPTRGTAAILGHDLVSQGAEARALVGYLPDAPGFPSWMTASRFLRFAGELFDVERRVLHKRVSGLLKLAGLDDVTTPIGAYSRGMKQRLGVAQALVNAPRVLLLDEPTSALDPLGRRAVLDMVASLRGRTTVFFSTHILADVERVCDAVAILDHGRVALETSIDQLRERHGDKRRITVEVDDARTLAQHLRTVAWAQTVAPLGDNGLRIGTDDLATAQRALPRLVADLDLRLSSLRADELSLEDVFVDLVGRDQPHAREAP